MRFRVRYHGVLTEVGRPGVIAVLRGQQPLTGRLGIDWAVLALLARLCQRIILSLPFTPNQQRLLSFFPTAYQANKTLQKQFVGIFRIQTTGTLS